MLNYKYTKKDLLYFRWNNNDYVLSKDEIQGNDAFTNQCKLGEDGNYVSMRKKEYNELIEEIRNKYPELML